MADLPRERLSQEPPFTCCGIDMFGPILVKKGCKEMKRYGCLFISLSSRAVHIKSTNSLSTDTFIQAFQRFVIFKSSELIVVQFCWGHCRTGQGIFRDEPQKSNEFMLEHGGQWIQWKRNPPTASNTRGVWEQQIRSACSILVVPLKIHETSLNAESCQTFHAEAEAIANTRPITSESLSDVHIPVPLCPMQLLIMKSRAVLPHPGEFQKEDIYSRNQWRCVQHLANKFWSRWKKEVYATLQVCHKCNKIVRNVSGGRHCFITGGDD